MASLVGLGRPTSKGVEPDWASLPKLLTLRSTSQILRVHPNTLRQWDRSGKLRAVRLGTRRDRRYDQADVRMLWANQTLPLRLAARIKSRRPAKPETGSRFPLGGTSGQTSQRVRRLATVTAVLVVLSSSVLATLRTDAANTNTPLKFSPEVCTGWERSNLATEIDISAETTDVTTTWNDQSAYFTSSRQVVSSGNGGVTTGSLDSLDENLRCRRWTQPGFKLGGDFENQRLLIALKSTANRNSTAAYIVEGSFDAGRTWTTLVLVPAGREDQGVIAVDVPQVRDLTVLTQLEIRVRPNIDPVLDQTEAWVDGFALEINVQAAPVSARVSQQAKNKLDQLVSFSQQAYRSTEQPLLKVPKKQVEKFLFITRKVTTWKIQSLVAVDIAGNETPLPFTGQDSYEGDNVFTTVHIDARNLRPGKYTIRLTALNSDGLVVTSQEVFLWGVAAINVTHAVARPGDEQVVGLGVLDDAGVTICDADLRLIVTDPRGKVSTYSTKQKNVQTSGVCVDKGVTNQPDYAVRFNVDRVGLYHLRLEANTHFGQRIVEEVFESSTSAAFNIDRFDYPTRIYPLAKYPVRIAVTPTRDFSGTIREQVPTDFVITDVIPTPLVVQKNFDNKDRQDILWAVDWKQGQTYFLSYTFDAPNISPALFLAGPMAIGGDAIRGAEFVEPRQWQIASDSIVAVEAGDFALEQDDVIDTLETAYRGDANVDLKLYKKGFKLKPGKVKAGLGANEPTTITKVEVVDPTGAVPSIATTSEEFSQDGRDIQILHLAPARQFRPGRYTLKLTVTDGTTTTVEERTFEWGVLAVNLRRSIEALNTSTTIGLAALDSTGVTLCNETLDLVVTDPEGKKQSFKTANKTIDKNPNCFDKGVTNDFDYSTTYKTGGVGVYQMTLTAGTGNEARSINDSFEVRDSVDFDIERDIFSMRVYPLADYPTQFTIKSNVDYQGVVTETVPASFAIQDMSNAGTALTNGADQVITWTVDWKAGETHTLGYTIDYPDISPEFYLLGPLVIGDPNGLNGARFQEVRQWQIASDAVTANGNIYYGDTTNVGKLKMTPFTSPSTYGTEVNINLGPAVNIMHVAAKTAPTREEKMIGFISGNPTTDGRLDIVTGTTGFEAAGDYTLRWTATSVTDGQDCDAAPTLGTCTQPFDLGYEALSGRGLVVYAGDADASAAPDADKVYYAFWDGSAWSPDSTPNTPSATNELNLPGTGGTPKWVRVAMVGDNLANTRANRAMILVADSDDDLYAFYWDGTNFDAGTELFTTLGGCGQGRCFDGNWQGTTNFVVSYSNAGQNEVRYQKYSVGSGWVVGDTQAYTTSAPVYSIVSAADPTSSRIISGNFTTTNDTRSAVWRADDATDGWTVCASGGCPDTNAEGDGGPQMSVAFERFNGEGLHVFNDAANGTAQGNKYMTYAQPSTWGTATVTGITPSDDHQSTKAIQSPNSDDIMIIAADVDCDVDAVAWTGAGFGTVRSNFELVLSSSNGSCANSIPIAGMATTGGYDFAWSIYSPWGLNWRFTGDTSTATPGSWLAAENTTPTGVADATTYRLRYNFVNRGTTSQPLTAEGRKKLQFTSDDPESLTATWTDVDAAAGAGIWRYNNCTSGTDDGAIPSTQLTVPSGGTGTVGDFIEGSGNITMTHNAGPAVAVENDYCIEANGVTGSTTYYFRAYDNEQQTPVWREQDNDGAVDCATAACTYPNLTTAAQTITVSGTVRGTDESAAIGNPPCDSSTQAVRIRVNGTATNTTTSCSSADGTYTKSSIDKPSAGATITVYLDEQTANASSVTRYDGSGNVTLDLMKDRVLVNSDDATAVTNTIMDQWDSDNEADGVDGDLGFTVTAGALTVSNTRELHVASGKTFTPGGTVTTNTGGAQSGVGGDVHIVGTLTMGTNSLSVGGDYNNAGTFNKSATQTTTFAATATGFTIAPGTGNFANLTFNGSGGDWTPSAAVNVDEVLTMTAGQLKGTQNVTVTGGAVGTAGTINLTGGTFDQSVAAAQNFGPTTASTNWTFSTLTFSSTTGSPTITAQSCSTCGVTVTGTMNISKSGMAGTAVTLAAGDKTWTLSNPNSANPLDNDGKSADNGVFTANTSTVDYAGDNDAGDVVIENLTYNNLNLTSDGVAENYDAAGTSAVSGTLTVGTNATLVGTDAWSFVNVTSNGTVNLTSASTATFTATGTVNGSGSKTFYNITTSGTGTTTISTATNAGNNVSVGTGTTLKINADMAITGTITNAGTGVITTDAGTPTVTITGTGSMCGVSTCTFYNLTFGGASTTFGSSFTVKNNLILPATVTAGSTTVTMDGAAGNITGAGATINNLTISNTSGTVSLITSDLTVGSVLTVSGGGGSLTLSSGRTMILSATGATAPTISGTINGPGRLTFRASAAFPTTGTLGSTLILRFDMVTNNMTMPERGANDYGTVEAFTSSATGRTLTLASGTIDLAGNLEIITTSTGRADVSGVTNAPTMNITGNVFLDPSAGNDARVLSGSGTWTVSGNIDADDCFSTCSSTFEALVLNGTSKSIQTTGAEDFTTVTIDGTYTKDGTVGDMSIDGSLIINTGKSLAISSGHSVIIVTPGTITQNGTGAINGPGRLTYQNASITFPSTGSLGSALIVRFDTLNGNMVIPARTDYGSIEAYGDSANPRTVTLGTAGAQTITTSSNFYVMAEASTPNDITLQGATWDPTLNVGGDFDFTGIGGGTESITSGTGTWTVGGSVNFTDGTYTATSGNTLIMNGTGTLTTNANALQHFTTSGSGTITLADATHTIAGNLTLGSSATITAGTSTVTMTGTSNTIDGGGKTLNALTIDPASAGTITLQNNDLTVSNVLTVASGDVLTINNAARTLTLSANAGTSLSMTSATINGPGRLTYQNSAGATFPDDGTLAATLITRFDTVNGNVIVPARIDYGVIEAFGGSANARTVTLGTGTTQTITTSSHFYVIADAASTNHVTLQGATWDPTLNVGGDFDFTGTGASLEIVTAPDAAATWTISGNVNLQDNQGSPQAGTWTPGAETVRLNGAAKQTVTSAGQTLFNLTLTNTSGSFTGCGSPMTTPGIDFADALTVSNNYTITTQGVKVEYNSGSTYTFQNVNWNGVATDGIVFRSSAESAWNLDINGTQTDVSYVSVAWSNATLTAGGVVASNGTNTDCNNNTNWTFISSIDISGVCKAFDQATNCADLGTIRVAVGGTLKAETDVNGGSGGTWSILNVPGVTSGNIITVFIDGAAAGDRAVGITKYDGTGPISGMFLYKEHLGLGSDDSSVVLTSAELGSYDNSISGDADVFHEYSETFTDSTCSVNTGGGTVCMQTDYTGFSTQEELYIKSGTTYRPDSGGGDLVYTHDYETDGTLTLDANTMRFSGSWLTNVGGVFTSGTSTVIATQTATVTETIDSLGSSLQPFNNMTFDDGGGTATFQLTSAFDADSNVTITGGNFDANSQAITVGGNWDNDDTFTSGTQTTTFDATDTDNTIDADGTGAEAFSSVTFAGAGGGNGTWTLNTAMSATGTVNVNTGDTLSIDSAMTLTHSGATLTLDGTISGAGRYEYQGATAFPATGTISSILRMNAVNNAQSLDCSGGGRTFGGAVEFYNGHASTARVITLCNAISQIANFSSNITVDGAGGGALTLEANTNDPAVNVTGNLTTGTAGTGAETVSLGGGIWTVTGNVTFTNSTITNYTGGTLKMDGTGGKTLTGGSAVVHNLNFDPSSAATINIAGNIESVGTVTVAAGDIVDINNGILLVLGWGGSTNLVLAGTLQGAGLLDYTPNVAFPDTGTMNVDLRMNGGQTGSQILSNRTYGGDVTFYSFAAETTLLEAGTFDFSGYVRVEAPGGSNVTVDAATNDPTINITGELNYNGAGAGLEIINAGTGVWTVGGLVDFYDAQGTPQAGQYNTETGNTLKMTATGANRTIDTAGSSLYKFEVAAVSNTVTLEAALTATDDVTITTGTLDAHVTENNALSVGGHFTNNGTAFTARSGTVTMTGTTKNITGSTATTFNNLTISGTTSVATSDPTVTTLLTVDTTKSLTIGSGRTVVLSNTGAGALTLNGTLNGPGRLTYRSSTAFPTGGTLGAVLILRYDLVTNAMTTAVRTDYGTIEAFNSSASSRTLTIGNGTHTLSGNFTMETTGAGALIVAGDTNNVAVTATGNVTVTAANGAITLSLGSNTWTVGGNFDLTNVTTFNHNSGTLTMNTGTTGTLTSNSKLLNNYTINAAGVVTLAAATHTLEGNLSLGGAGNPTVTGSTILMNGLNKTITGGSKTLDNLTISNTSGTISLVSTVSISSLLTVSGGGGNLTLNTGTDMILTKNAASPSITLTGTLNGPGELFYRNATDNAFPTTGTIAANLLVQFDADNGDLNIPARTDYGSIYVTGYSANARTVTLGTAGGQTITTSGNFWVDAGAGVGNDVTIQGATWDPTLNIGGNFDFVGSGDATEIIIAPNSPAIWTVTGHVTLTNGTWTAGAETLKMNGTTKTLTTDSEILNNLEINSGGAITLAAETHTLLGNLVLAGAGTPVVTGSTINMTGSAKSIQGGSKTLNSLTITDNTTLDTTGLTLAGTLTVAASKTFTVTTVTLTMNSTSAEVSWGASSIISGTGTVTFTNGAGGPGNGGTLSTPVRFDSTSGDVASTTFDARTYGGLVETYSNSTSNRTVTFATGTYTFSGAFNPRADNAGDVFVDGGTNSPTVGVTGDVDFTGAGSGTEVLAMGDGTWTVSGNVNFTDGAAGAQIAQLTPSWDDGALKNDFYSFSCTPTTTYTCQSGGIPTQLIYGRALSAITDCNSDEYSDDTYRAAMKFPTANIPDAATITKVELVAQVGDAVSENVLINRTSSDSPDSWACSASSTLFSNLATSNWGVNAIWTSTGQKVVDLGQTAITDVQSRIGVGQSMGVSLTTSEPASVGATGYIESVDGTPDPVLRVTYAIGTTSTLIMNGTSKTLTSAGNHLYNLTLSGTITLANATHTIDGNLDMTGGDVTPGTSTVTMAGVGKTIKAPAAGDTLNALVIDPVTAGTVTLDAAGGNLTVSNSLTVFTGDTLSIGSGRTLTLSNTASLSLINNGTISGAGTLTYQNLAARPFLATGTISSILRMDATAGDQAIEGTNSATRTFGGVVEIYNSSGSTNRTVTLENGTARTFTFSSHLYIIADSATNNATLSADTATDPTVNVTGDVDFTGTLAGSEVITSGSGTWTVNGNVDFTGGTYDATTGNTFTLASSTASSTLDSACANTDSCANQNFHNLTINKTSAVDANDNVTLTTNGINVANTLTITDGELVQGALNVRAEGSTAVSVGVAGKWSNISTGDIKLGGSFANAGTVSWDKDGNGDGCGAGDTDDITFTTTDGATVRSISGAGTFTLYDLTISFMNATVAITANGSTDAGSNTGSWTINGCGITISGNIYTNDATTALDCSVGGARTVAVKVNGAGTRTGDCTLNTGAFSITAVTIGSAGDVVTVFLSGETEKAATVTLANNTTSPISSLPLRTNRLVVTHESAGPMTNSATTGLGRYDKDNDATNFFFTANTNNLSVDAGYKLLVNTGKSFTPGGTVTTAAASVAGNVDGDVEIQSSGAMAMGTNDLNVGGDYTNAGTFSKTNTQTTSFTATGSGFTVTPGTGDMNNVTFSGDAGGNGTWTLSTADLVVDGTLTVNTGDTLTIDTSRVLTNTGATDANNDGTINGAGTLRFTDASGGPDTNANSTGSYASIVRYDASAGSISNTTFDARTYGGDLELYSNVAGVRTITPNTGTYAVSGNFKTITGASQSSSFTVAANTNNPTVNVTGTVTFTKGGSATPTVTSGTGIWTVTGDFNATNGIYTPTSGNTLLMNGTANLNLSASSLYNLTVDGTNTTVTVHGNGATIDNTLTIGGAADGNNDTLSLTGNAVITNASGSVVIHGSGADTISGGGFLHMFNPNLSLNGTITALVKFNNTNNNIDTGTPVPARAYGGGLGLDDSGSSGTRTIALGSGTFTITGNLDLLCAGCEAGLSGINYNFTFHDPTITVSGNVAAFDDFGMATTLDMSSATTTVGGNFDMTWVDTFNHNSGTLKMNGTSKSITSNGKTLNNFEVSGGSITQVAALTVAGTFVESAGVFTQAANNDLLITGSAFTLASSTTFTKASGSGLLILDGNPLTFTDSNATKQDLGNVRIGASPATTNLHSDKSVTSLTIPATDTYNTRGWDVDVSGAVDCQSTCVLDMTDTGGANYEGNGTIITVGANWTMSGTGTFTQETTGGRESKIYMKSTAGSDANRTITTGGKAFRILETDNAGTTNDDMIVSGNLTVTGTLTVTDGQLDLNTNDPTTDVDGAITIASTGDLVASNSAAFTAGGNYTNNGVFTDSGGTVTFDGAAQQTLSGQMTGSGDDFNNLTITNVSGSDPESSPSVIFSNGFDTAGTFTATTANTKMRFTSGQTYTPTAINFNGQATGTRVALRSSSIGTAVTFNAGAGSRSVSNTSIRDSNACGSSGGSIDSSDGTNEDRGNAPCWTINTISLTISDVTVGFGTCYADNDRFATGSAAGADTDATDAHTITLSTNVTTGYSLTVFGPTLTRVGGGPTITAIGGTATASALGTEQYGMRVIKNSGAGNSVAPYNTSNWAYDGASTPDEIASHNGSASTTEYGVRYICNIAGPTDPGSYTTDMTYVLTASF